MMFAGFFTEGNRRSFAGVTRPHIRLKDD